MIAVYVGVVAVSQILKDNYKGGAMPAELYGLGVVALLALIGGIWIIRRIDKDLTKYRIRIDQSRELLSEVFQKATDPEGIEVREETSRTISGILQRVILFAGLVVVYLVAGRQLLELIV